MAEHLGQGRASLMTEKVIAPYAMHIVQGDKDIAYFHHAWFKLLPGSPPKL